MQEVEKKDTSNQIDLTLAVQDQGSAMDNELDILDAYIDPFDLKT